MGSEASQGLSVSRRVTRLESPQPDPVTSPQPQALFLEQKEEEPLCVNTPSSPHLLQRPLPCIVSFVLRDWEGREQRVFVDSAHLRAQAYGCPCFDTTPMVAEGGLHQALLRDGTSSWGPVMAVRAHLAGCQGAFFFFPF